MMVKGDLPDFDVAVRRPGELEGTMIELKKTRPMKTIRTHQKVCLIALGRSRFGFALSPAVKASFSVPQFSRLQQVETSARSR
jgi:hypothetical protein